MNEVLIEIFEVRDRGIPNRECIILRALQPASLANFFVGIGFPREPNNVAPINDNLFWLGSGSVLAGDWIYLYTGSGKPVSAAIPNQVNTVHSIYWQRRTVLFQSDEIVPYVFAADTVHIAKSPQKSHDLLGIQSKSLPPLE